ncbi:nucleotidyltransferase family protein [Sulfurimonas sp. HSL1-2]|uniref:nucleotidyltransferase domain-containing protein n=1 Tax=Thiomicrolovo zhangzhouensis TaxID=3131933 RepID=UPI0031F8D0EB
MHTVLSQKRPHSDALRFLIACCQAEPSQEEIDLIASFTSTVPSDRHDLLAVASAHGLLPLVYKSLKNLVEQKRFSTKLATATAHLQTLIADLQSAYMQIAQRNMLMSAELLQITKRLEENGIKAVTFKGPALAQLLYGDITLRQFGDLDLLIHRKDIDLLKHHLGLEGYKDTLLIPTGQEQQWYRNAKDMVLYHPQKHLPLELHWQLLDTDYPIRINLHSIWSEAQPLQINGHAIRTFSNEALLIYLCVHGSKHLWERVGWIKDIDVLIRTQPIDWHGVSAQMAGGNFRRLLLLGLHLSSRHFDTPLPSAFEPCPKDRHWLVPLTRFVESNWVRRAGMFSNTRAMLQLFPTLPMKLRYLNKVLFKPSKNEYRTLNLPRELHWAYFFLRPYLLIKKYLRPNSQ